MTIRGDSPEAVAMVVDLEVEMGHQEGPMVMDQQDQEEEHQEEDFLGRRVADLQGRLAGHREDPVGFPHRAHQRTCLGKRRSTRLRRLVTRRMSKLLQHKSMSRGET